MNGIDHYRKAERLLAGTHFKIEGEPFHNPPSERDVAQAQVHATLALAAATALNDSEPGMPVADFRAWREVAGVPIPTCSQCDREVLPGNVYCSTACRNLDDRHDDGREADDEQAQP